MPCSICGGIGHNRRTCTENPQFIPQPIPPEEPPPPKIDDGVFTMLIIENELRNIIIQNKINELSSDKIKFFETFLGIQQKEFNLINLEKERTFKLFILNNNSKLFDINKDNIDMNTVDWSYIGEIRPRELYKIKSFTGYSYFVIDEYNIYDSIHVMNEMNDTQLINYIVDISIPSGGKPSTKQLSNENKNLFASLKMNYIIQQMIRLGVDNEEKYSEFEPLLELHQDIELPHYDNIDLEAAGLPNEFTNIT